MEHQIIAAYAGVVVGLGQLGMIGWGLWRMGKSSGERNRQLDQQGEVLGELAAGLREQTRASSEALGELMAGLREQTRASSEALGELLRRTA